MKQTDNNNKTYVGNHFCILGLATNSLIILISQLLYIHLWEGPLNLDIHISEMYGWCKKKNKSFCRTYFQGSVKLIPWLIRWGRKWQMFYRFLSFHQEISQIPLLYCFCCCSVTESCPTLCHPMDCRLLHPALSPGVCSYSCPLSQWCYLNIPPSATLFFCLQYFLMSQLFTSGGQSILYKASKEQISVFGVKQFWVWIMTLLHINCLTFRHIR